MQKKELTFCIRKNFIEIILPKEACLLRGFEY